ncbi:MAG: phytoene/squalene synthase family protein [Hyphomicrobiales bacterium]|nr:phytoene/squalene synthase family protein [Hyphomicrobiales bacterium]
MSGTYDHCADLARAADRDRYLAALLAPRGPREELMALYAFDAELCGVRAKISEPLAGEIRLQWWRDAIAVLYRGEGGESAGHPVLQALKPAIAAGKLPLDAFQNLINARIFDLYDDPIASMTELEGYLGDTFGAVIQLSCLILSRGADVGSGTAAGHAGVATGIGWLLRALPRHAAEEKLYVPRDLIARNGLSSREVVGGQMSGGLAAALGELRDIASKHLEAARTEAGRLPAALRPAFAPCALVAPYLAASERCLDPLQEEIAVNPLRRQWRIWRAARRGL